MNKIKKLLFYSYDKDMTREELYTLDAGLEHSPQLREEKKQIALLRSLLIQENKPHFSSNFSDRIMIRINEEHQQESYQETIFKSLYGLFKPIAIAAVILLIVILSYNIIQKRQLASYDTILLPDTSLEIAFDPVLPLILE